MNLYKPDIRLLIKYAERGVEDMQQQLKHLASHDLGDYTPEEVSKIEDEMKKTSTLITRLQKEVL
jgi:hypothetical protein